MTTTDATTEAPPLGFWAIAEARPDHVALVTPERREVRAGKLAAAAHQVVHGLRAAGLGVGDAVAMLLPNSAEVFELYLAALEAGFYLVPINWHLVGPEIAYIVQDSEAKAFVAHARFADAAQAAVAEIDFPSGGRFAVGGDIPGFRSYDDLKAAGPTTPPEDRTTGAVMNYTSGTTGKPKGVRRPLPGTPPEQSAAGNGGMLSSSSCSPSTTTCTSAGRRCTTRPCSSSRAARSTSGTRSC